MSDVNEKDVSQVEEPVDDLSLEDKIAALDNEAEAEEKADSSEEEKLEEEVEQEASEEEPAEEVEAEEGQNEKESETDSYKPDYTYRVHGEEKKFDDKIKEYIKSKEDEDFFRELYTRADGVNVIKPKLEKYREEATEYKTKVEDLNQKVESAQNSWNYLEDLRVKGKSGDSESIERLLDALDWDDRTLGKVVADRLQRSPQDQQNRRLASQAQAQQYQVSTQAEQISSREAELIRRENEIALDEAFRNDKETVDVAQAVDEKLGEGSFLNEVIEVGKRLEQEAEQSNKPYPTYKQVFDLVADKYKRFLSVSPNAENKNTQELVKENNAAPTNKTIKKKVIVKDKNGMLNVGSGSGESPVARKITSLEDLEAERDAHFGIDNN